MLNKNRQNPDLKSIKTENTHVRPGAFVFCERVSGAIRFQVEADPFGMLPIEQAASLLAMHCLVRGQTPCDYTVLIVPRGSLLDPVGQRAAELLEAGRAAGSDVRLSPRERDVLDCVVRNLANKEIAAQLNISERTVKFHVSALLAKFKVRDRISLMREAIMGLMPSASPVETLFGYPVPAQVAQAEPRPVAESRGNTRVLRLPGRQSFA
jgi:DNA-binding CsgD family transcriptional regulator